jgi:hypothetical protein
MRATVLRWRDDSWETLEGVDPRAGADLVIWFAAPDLARDPRLYDALRDHFPSALIAGCSTGGEIIGGEATDQSAVAAVVSFDRARVRGVRADVVRGGSIRDLGARLATVLAAPDLKGVYVLSDGTLVNGAALVEGLTGGLAKDVVVTGGLAGDGADFRETRVGLDAQLAPSGVVAVGFYGEGLTMGWGSAGGWEPFGPEREITASEDNILLQLDGRPALELYKQYLGAAAAQLPGSALLFPLVIRPQAGSDYDVVRTIVGVDEARQGLIFAGDMPVGWSAQLMRGSPDDLADGAADAARQAGHGGRDRNGLALLVSCIGRKLMMGQRVSDEVESISEVLGDVAMLGFYSYGEIAPHGFTGACTLHNQTMTITMVREAA